MSRRKQEQFQTITVSGAMLPPDILQKIVARHKHVEGLTPEAYHLPEGTKLNEAIAQSWTVVQAHWKSFNAAREELADDDTGTSVTNEKWLLPLFKELEYGRLTTTEAPEIDERSYPIRRFYNHTPIHLIGCNLPLDRRTKGAAGAATASPHAIIQEYLNRSDDHLWAFLSNGLQLRILRDNISLSRQAYVEFDLAAMMDGEIYADFALLWLLCHQSRVEAERPDDCWLEKWSKLAREAGTRVLNDPRIGVANAIEALGRGFIGHPRNDQLRAKLQETGELSKDDYYRQLLRIVYRLLFLFVAEDRSLLHPPDADAATCDLYDAHYSTRRLRDMAVKLRGSKHADLWHSLSLVFDSLSEPEGCPQLGLPALGTFLWRSRNTPDLIGPAPVSRCPEGHDPVLITNDDLLTAIRALAFVEQDKVLRAVDYRNLGSEELGSVYESLLELHPVMHVEAKSFDLSTAAGNERKTTGSYYTPDSLVQCLLDSALDPVVEDRLKGKKGEQAEQAILEMKVCDPACGSGHFLIAAAHRLARHLARIRTGESEASPEDYQHALRDVIGRCIYGVDINPMAVELCKVSLWMEAIDPGRPLSFLDHHIQCGNSLLGTTPALLASGMPDDAFKPVEGDVKAEASKLKKTNKKGREEHSQQSGKLQRVIFDTPQAERPDFEEEFARLASSSDDSVADVAEKERRYAELVSGADYENARLLANTWCAVFVWQKDTSELGKLCPTERDFRKIENNPPSILPQVRSEVRRLADQYQFFHWHLAFPDVFVLPEEAGKAENEQTGWSRGFDVVLGNPPWERMQVEEKQFFASSRPDIASARSRDRRKLIESLDQDEPELARAWRDACRQSVGQSHIVKQSGRFPFGARGNVNTFAVFAESAANLISVWGRAAIIVPSGLITEAGNKDLFNHWATKRQIVQALDFENRAGLFPDVDSRFRFCLLTLSGDKRGPEFPVYAFFLHELSDLSDPLRLVRFSHADINRINPSSGTCPPVKSRRDADLLTFAHRTFGVFVNDATESGNPWEFTSKQMLNTSHNSSEFVDPSEEIIDRIDSFGRSTDQTSELLRLYEGNMIDQFDHRLASASYNAQGTIRTTANTQTTVEQHRDPTFLVRPQYWVRIGTVHHLVPSPSNTRNWLMAYRAITASTNWRTFVSAIVPYSGIVHSAPAVYSPQSAVVHAILLGLFNSFVVDFFSRLKLGGTNLSHYVVKQLPISSPEHIDLLLRNSTILSRNFFENGILELTYTAWDLEAFALDCGYDGPPFRWDEERRFLLRCELDAAYFHLYLGSPSEWGAANPELREMFPTPRDAVDYIMDTFPIVKRKDIKRTAVLDDAGEVTTDGTYITKDTILEIYDEMQTAIDTGVHYQTRLDPPPGPPTDDDGNFTPMDQWDESNGPQHVHESRKTATSSK